MEWQKRRLLYTRAKGDFSWKLDLQYFSLFFQNGLFKMFIIQINYKRNNSNWLCVITIFCDLNVLGCSLTMLSIKHWQLHSKDFNTVCWSLNPVHWLISATCGHWFMCFETWVTNTFKLLFSRQNLRNPCHLSKHINLWHSYRMIN